MSELMGHVTQVADAIERNGTPIVVRRSTRSPGPVPLMNPPRVLGAATSSATPEGFGTVSLRATAAVGRLVPGDKLLLGTVILVVLAETAARPQTGPNGFLDVPVAPFLTPVPGVVPALADSMPVAFRYAADLHTHAMINSFPPRLVNGDNIRSRDLAVTLPADKLPEIEATWTLVFKDRDLVIVQADPVLERGDVVKWAVQAR